MGHLLSSVNKDAAEAIGREEQKQPLPGIGETVRFFPRPGELRSGKGEYAALVTGRDEADYTLDLVVFFDVDDSIGQKKMPRRNPDQPRGWEFLATTSRQGDITQAPLTADDAKRLAALEQVTSELAAELMKLRQVIFGEFEPPNEPFVEILSEHEDRLVALEPKAKVAPKAKRKGK